MAEGTVGASNGSNTMDHGLRSGDEEGGGQMDYLVEPTVDQRLELSQRTTQDYCDVIDETMESMDCMVEASMTKMTTLMNGDELEHGMVDIVKERCDEDDVNVAAVDGMQCEDDELERWLEQILIDDDDSDKGELCINMDSPKDDNCVSEGRPTSDGPVATDVFMAATTLA